MSIDPLSTQGPQYYGNVGSKGNDPTPHLVDLFHQIQILVIAVATNNTGEIPNAMRTINQIIDSGSISPTSSLAPFIKFYNAAFEAQGRGHKELAIMNFGAAIHEIGKLAGRQTPSPTPLTESEMGRLEGMYNHIITLIQLSSNEVGILSYIISGQILDFDHIQIQNREFLSDPLFHEHFKFIYHHGNLRAISRDFAAAVECYITAAFLLSRIIGKYSPS